MRAAAGGSLIVGTDGGVPAAGGHLRLSPGYAVSTLVCMTRRCFVGLPSLTAVAAPLPQRLPGTAYRDYSRCLPDYLRGLARQAYERRNRELAKLTTPQAVRARQAWARETF